MESVHLRDSESCEFKYVDMRQARHQKRHSETNIVWVNARHLSQNVVLKTTTDHYTQLKYILDAVIHYHVFRICPKYLPNARQLHGEAAQRAFLFHNTLAERRVVGSRPAPHSPLRRKQAQPQNMMMTSRPKRTFLF
jgi:hypothetical protein